MAPIVADGGLAGIRHLHNVISDVLIVNTPDITGGKDEACS
jgi:hypothetical protein